MNECVCHRTGQCSQHGYCQQYTFIQSIHIVIKFTVSDICLSRMLKFVHCLSVFIKKGGEKKLLN